VEKDYKEAVRLYRLSAIQGHAVAQLALGDCYHFARGVNPDPNEAIYWYRLAAFQGNTEAQIYLEKMEDD